MAGRFNHSLLQFLQTCTQKKADSNFICIQTLSSTGVCPLKWCLPKHHCQIAFLQRFYLATVSIKRSLEQNQQHFKVLQKHTCQRRQLIRKHCIMIVTVINVPLKQVTLYGSNNLQWGGSWTIKLIHTKITLQITNGNLGKSCSHQFIMSQNTTKLLESYIFSYTN